MGTLFVVATPIGNLEDLTFRAARVLRSVEVVVVEDPQRARKLLGHLGCTPKVITYREDSPESREDAIIERLRAGDAALIVDAGTPGVSDPGPDLLFRVRAEGLPIVPVPGPSALTTALSVVSFARQPVAFLAFLPERRVRRERLVRRSADTARTLVIYLPPHGAAERLAELEAWLGDVPAAMCRELTKLYEEIRESTLADIANYVAVVGARGELTLVIDVGGVAEAPEVDRATVEEQLRSHLDAGVRPAKAAGAVARALELSREDVYLIARELRGPAGGSA
jgi:16S rRNA (cytidine1402-2'-O)-methyltransferase